MLNIYSNSYNLLEIRITRFLFVRVRISACSLKGRLIVYSTRRLAWLQAAAGRISFCDKW